MIDFYFLGKRDDNDELSSRVRKFYKQQDDLIDSLEEIDRYNLNTNDTERTNKLKKQKRHMDWLIRATVICNCVSKLITIEMRTLFFLTFSFIDIINCKNSSCSLFKITFNYFISCRFSC